MELRYVITSVEERSAADPTVRLYEVLLHELDVLPAQTRKVARIDIADVGLGEASGSYCRIRVRERLVEPDMYASVARPGRSL